MIFRCKYCTGPLVELGILGKLMWVRCVNCGAEWWVRVDESILRSVDDVAEDLYGEEEED